MELENDEIHIVLRHFQIYSSVEKTFTKKDIALKYAAEMDKLENDNLPEHARGYHTVVTSKLEETY
ncbi:MULTISPECIES: hypothetical protein [unclassified Paenibacillus]|uniref:hypothetical protein n=1 Tax=unclassified Paenibacillus TaxID=185978 RepID=UPI0030F93D42